MLRRRLRKVTRTFSGVGWRLGCRGAGHFSWRRKAAELGCSTSSNSSVISATNHTIETCSKRANTGTGRDSNTMMGGSRKNNGCPDCNGVFVKDGKCVECQGSGRNIHLNATNANCRVCSGSGLCIRCSGTGLKAWTTNDLGGRAQRRGYLTVALQSFIFPVVLQSWLLTIPSLALAAYFLFRSLKWRHRSRAIELDD